MPLALVRSRGRDIAQRVDVQHVIALRDQVKLTVYLYPYLMELCLAMKEGNLAPIEGLSLEKMIQSMIKGKNIFLKGVAYRYEAILRKRSGEPYEKIHQSLEKSMKWLKESGQQIELSKTKIELARNYLSMGEDEKAKEIIEELIATAVHSHDSSTSGMSGCDFFPP